MESHDKETPQTRRICDDRINYAKLKEDGATAAINVREKLTAPVSECSRKIAHSPRADECRRAPARHQNMEVAEMEDMKTGHSFDGAPILAKALGMALEAHPKKTLKVDVARYEAFLDDPAMSQEDREQLLSALWQIVVCFVDLGYEVAPLQLACGEVAENEGFCGTGAQDVVSSEDHTLSDRFNQVAGS